MPRSPRAHLRHVAVVCGVLVALLAGRVAAEPTPMASAWRHYQALEYDQALASLVDARRVATTSSQRNEVMLLEGFVQIALDRKDEALALFRQVLRSDPAQKLSASTSPKITTLFEQARTLERERARHHAELSLQLLAPTAPEVAARGIDLVVVVTKPFLGLSGHVVVENMQSHARAQVPLSADADGKWRGRIPAALAEPNAVLSLRAELVHEGDVVATSPGLQEPTTRVKVPPFAAALRIESSMEGAVVRVDGREIGRVPVLSLVPVSVGRVRVELDGAKGSIGQDVEVVAGEVTRVSLTVEARSRLPIARYFLIGLGSALLITGGVLFDQSARADAQYHALIVRDPTTGLPRNDYSTAAPQERSARAFQIAASVSVAVGGTAAIVGLALFAVRGKRADRRVAMTEAGLGWRF